MRDLTTDELVSAADRVLQDPEGFRQAGKDRWKRFPNLQTALVMCTDVFGEPGSTFAMAGARIALMFLEEANPPMGIGGEIPE
jgi:hypothetical protein